MANGTGQTRIAPFDLARLLRQPQVPLSVPGGGIVNASNSILQALALRKGQQAEAAKEEAAKAGRSQALQRAFLAASGTTGPRTDVAAAGVGAAPPPAGFDRQAFARALAGSGEEDLQRLGLQQMLAAPAGGQGFTLSPGQERRGPQGKLIARAAAAAEKPPQATPLVRNLEALGLKRGTPEFNAALRQQLAKTGQSITVNGQKLPPPPSGMIYALDEEGEPLLRETEIPGGGTARVPVLVPVSGGPVEEARTAADLAAETAESQGLRKATQITNDIDEIFRIQKGSPVPVTGLFGAAGAQLPFGPARNVRVLLNGIEANLTLDALQNLRASSASGASGLGQVTRPELDILRSTYGDLTQAQDEPQFNRLLNRLKSEFEDAVYGKSGRFGKMSDDQLLGISPASLSESGRQMFQSEMDKRGGLAKSAAAMSDEELMRSIGGQ